MKKFNVLVNGKAYEIEVEEVGLGQPSYTSVAVQQTTQMQQTQPRQVLQTTLDKKSATSASTIGENMVAPMPGTILDIKVSEGQTVKAGDVVIILEAMKMENEIVSPKDGIVTKIFACKGNSVSSGDSLAIIN